MNEEPQWYIDHSLAIGNVYKFIGLYSIPVLTVATTISMVNVFTGGALSQWRWLEFVWAIVFSVAIEVNVSRLLSERTKLSVALGLCLAVVAGIALIIEGLQQTIGVSWDNVWLHRAVVFSIILRVVVVVALMAVEAHKQRELRRSVAKSEHLSESHLSASSDHSATHSPEADEHGELVRPPVNTDKLAQKQDSQEENINMDKTAESGRLSVNVNVKANGFYSRNLLAKPMNLSVFLTRRLRSQKRLKMTFFLARLVRSLEA